jgi:hypothetical protein
MFGFGGIPKLPNYVINEVSHCFPMTGNVQNPNVIGVQGMMECYNYNLQHV